MFCLLGSGVWLLSLSAFVPAWCAAPLFLLYALLGLAALPRRAPFRPQGGKRLAMLGQYWFSLQATLFFAGIPMLAGQAVLVWLLEAVSAALYARICLSVLAAVLLLDGYGWLHARHIRIRRFAHTVHKPGALPESLRIVHLSDLHLGPVTDLRAVRRIVGKVNALSPDLVCVTGDTFTEDVTGVYALDAVADALAGLHATFGVYGCLGNHDAGPQLPEMLAFFRRAGITLLRDEAVTLPAQVVLAGRNDPTPAGRPSPRASLEDVLSQADARLPLIVMDHQPATPAIEAAQRAGADLLLCGHTHGGQFFPIHLMVRRYFPHYYGPKRDGQLLTLVSPGSYAASPPLRIGSSAEIFVIELDSHR